MQGKKSLIVVATALLVIAGFLITATPVLAASQVEVLHAFTRGNDGAVSEACRPTRLLGSLVSEEIRLTTSASLADGR